MCNSSGSCRGGSSAGEGDSDEGDDVGPLGGGPFVARRETRIAEQRCTPDSRRIYGDPTIEPRIRAWAHLPDVLPMIRPKVDALLDADRKAAAKVREDLRLHEEDIAALERALGVTP